jgi:hypothetical protein
MNIVKLRTKFLKIWSIVIYLLLYTEGFSQTKYFLFEEDSKEFVTSSFRLNTYPLYKIKREVHLFNVMSRVQTFIGILSLFRLFDKYKSLPFNTLLSITYIESLISCIAKNLT